MNKEKKNIVVPKLRFPEFSKEGNWEEVSISKLLDYERPDAYIVSDTNYQKDGTPVLTANKSFILGYTKEEHGIYKNFPAIIFDDFTVDKKFVDFPFKVKSSAIKILKEKCDNNIRFIFELLSQIRFEAKEHKRYYISVYQNLLVNIPKPAEQQKIASCLSSLDDLITAHTQKLDSLKAHKKGLMQQLFPVEGEKVPKLRFEEFKDSGEWEDKTIQRLIDDKAIISHLDGNHGGLYPRSEEFSLYGIPYISANDFINGIINFDRCKFLPEERALQFKKGIAKDGDILFAHNATVGPVAKLKTSFSFVVLSTTATYFRCDNKSLLNDFLLYALSSPEFIKQYSRVMKQSTRDQVPITAQRLFSLSIPKILEQQKIASCLSSLDELITAQAEKIEQLKMHKKGLMQGLFPSLGKV